MTPEEGGRPGRGGKDMVWCSAVQCSAGSKQQLFNFHAADGERWVSAAGLRLRYDVFPMYVRNGRCKTWCIFVHDTLGLESPPP